VHEEAGWGVAVTDDAVGADSESLMCEVVVSGSPSVAVAAPAELWERIRKASLQSWKDVSLVSLDEPGPIHPSTAIRGALHEWRSRGPI
jgi:hypothetical protein